MRVDDIVSRNSEALTKLRESGSLDLFEHPFYGFYDVTIFECPPFVMFTADDCPRAADILGEGEFEPMSMKLWCCLAKSATAVFDIGAHVGVYSLAAASLRPELTIHAFEPNPYAFARLRVHKKVNGFMNIAEHIHALGEVSGVARFQWVRKPTLQISSGGHLGSGDSKYVDSTVCNIKNFDKLFSAADLGPSALMKMDVEGAESIVFNGMRQALTAKPDIILETFRQDACDYINEILLPMGYHVFAVKESARDIVAQDRLLPQNNENREFNQLLTAKSESELRALLA